jgi:hypothetical protein
MTRYQYGGDAHAYIQDQIKFLMTYVPENQIKYPLLKKNTGPLTRPR